MLNAAQSFLSRLDLSLNLPFSYAHAPLIEVKLRYSRPSYKTSLTTTLSKVLFPIFVTFMMNVALSYNSTILFTVIFSIFKSLSSTVVKFVTSISLIPLPPDTMVFVRFPNWVVFK